MSDLLLLSPATMSLALLVNTANLPFWVTYVSNDAPLAVAPAGVTLRAVMTPVCRSLRNTSSLAFTSPATRSGAVLLNVAYRPSLLSHGNRLAPRALAVP